MFERLRSMLRDALETAGESDQAVAKMREAVLEARTAVETMRAQLERTERALAVERRHHEDAERRGRLAADIEDYETVDVATRFARKHGERVAVLERKLRAQRDELTLAEHELTDMKDELKRRLKQRPQTDASRRVEAAWQHIEAAGGTRPSADPADQRLRSQLDRAAREARAEEQLEALKRKMGKG